MYTYTGTALNKAAVGYLPLVEIPLEACIGITESIVKSNAKKNFVFILFCL